MKEINKISHSSGEKPIALVAPLDWGLGHATRCIPLIKHLLYLDFEVIIAAEGMQKILISAEFPSLKIVDLPGYRLKYGSSGWKTSLLIMAQLPKILTAIKSEKRWLDRFLKDQRVDLIVSDNRYGLYHSSVKSVFITHQLTIKSLWHQTGEELIRKLHYRFIEEFDECWVPDYEGEDNLAGLLSHPPYLPDITVKYLGCLSRIDYHAGDKRFSLCILISGPEPQRTALEKLMLKELDNYSEPCVLIRGLPGTEAVPIISHPYLEIYNHLSAKELSNVLNASDIIICRSGYSSIMDIIPLGKLCILIPTPGQTEQIYLASYLYQQKKAVYFPQHLFHLNVALRTAREKRFQLKPLNERKETYKDVLSNLLTTSLPHE